MAGNRFAYNTLLSQNSVQTGGQVAGAPAPAPATYPFNLGSIEPTSLANALQQFGDAVQSFIHTAESTSNAAASAQAAVTAQVAASSNLTSASTALRNAFYGPSYTDDTGLPRTYDPGSANPQGLYKIIMDRTFKATRPAPAPAPA
jgi:hypothetical protein